MNLVKRLPVYLAIASLAACGGSENSQSTDLTTDDQIQKQSDMPVDTGVLDGKWQSACDELAVGENIYFQQHTDSYQGNKNTFEISIYEAADCTGAVIASSYFEYSVEYGEEFILDSGLTATRCSFYLNKTSYPAESEVIDKSILGDAVSGSIALGYFHVSEDKLYHRIYSGDVANLTPEPLSYDFPYYKVQD